MTTETSTRFDAFMGDLRTKLCAEFEASPSLRAEFTCGADYAAYRLNEPTAKPLIRRWREDFDAAVAERALLAAEARSNVRRADARRAVGRLRMAGC